MCIRVCALRAVNSVCALEYVMCIRVCALRPVKSVCALRPVK